MLSTELFSKKRHTPLTPDQLASKIARESHGIVIQVGQCNGKPVLHLKRQRDDERGIRAESVNMEPTEAAWNLHPWNKSNQPKPRKVKDAE
jgi:hypothetical protein